MVNTPIFKSIKQIEAELQETNHSRYVSTKKTLPSVPQIEYRYLTQEITNELVMVEIEAMDDYCDAFDQWFDDCLWTAIKKLFAKGYTQMEVIIELNKSRRLIDDYDKWEYTLRLIEHRAKKYQ